MPKLNFLVFLNSYSDTDSSNNPSLNNFKWNREVNGLFVNNPLSQAFSLAPGETKTLFNGTRTLTQDGTTQYSLTQVPLSTQTYQLNFTGGTNPTFRTGRTTGADASTQVFVTQNGPLLTFSAPAISALAAHFVGQVFGMTTNITITANNLGVGGNSILLTGNGTSSVSTLIAAWNTANPSNQATLSAGDGTQVPSLGATIMLSGGVNPATAFNLISGGVVVGDSVLIGNLFSPLNQGIYTIVSLTATSFTVISDNGIPEGPILLGVNFASQVNVYGSVGVQVGDTLAIFGGFSPVTQGSYVITGVTSTYIQFYTTAILPVEGPITTEDIAVYSAAKSFIYMEADQNCEVTLNGTNISNINPLVINNSTRPGVLMNSSTIYTITVTNNSITPANLYMASAEYLPTP